MWDSGKKSEREQSRKAEGGGGAKSTLTRPFRPLFASVDRCFSHVHARAPLDCRPAARRWGEKERRTSLERFFPWGRKSEVRVEPSRAHGGGSQRAWRQDGTEHSQVRQSQPVVRSPAGEESISQSEGSDSGPANASEQRLVVASEQRLVVASEGSRSQLDRACLGTAPCRPHRSASSLWEQARCVERKREREVRFSQC